MRIKKLSIFALLLTAFLIACQPTPAPTDGVEQPTQVSEEATSPPADQPTAAPTTAAETAAPPEATEPQAGLLGPVVVGAGIDAAFAQFFVAEELGFWEQCGVDATVNTDASGAETLEQVLADQIAMTLNGQANHPIAHSNGGNIYMIAENERSGLQFGASGVGIENPEDLEGKTVATQFGTSPEYHMRLYFDHYGLDTDTITVENVPFADLIPALARGDIDAFFAFDPHVTRAETEVPDGKVFHRSGDDNVFFLRTFLGISESTKDNPALAEALVCGVVKAGEWINSHRVETAEILAPLLRLSVEETLGFVNYFDYNVAFNDASVNEVRGVEEFFREAGIITGPIDYPTLMRPEFLEAVSPSRVLVTGENADLLGRPDPMAAETSSDLLGPVVVGAGIDAAFAQFFVAEELGFWKQCGVDATVNTDASGAETLEQVLADQIAMTLNGQANHPIAHSNGGNIYMIAENERSGLQFGASGVGIENPEDLEGKTVATQFGTSPEYHMRLYFDHYGLDTDTITVENVPFADLIPALARGDIDAFFAFDPHVTRAETEVPDGKVFHRSGDDNVFFLRTFLGISESTKDNPALAEALVCGVVKAGEWINSHRVETAEILAPLLRLSVEETLGFVNYFDYNVAFNDASVNEVRGVEEFFREAGIITGPIDYPTLMRPEFLEAVDPGRVLITGENADLLGTLIIADWGKGA